MEAFYSVVLALAVVEAAVAVADRLPQENNMAHPLFFHTLFEAKGGASSV